MGIRQNLIGQKFNRLTVTALHHRDARARAFYSYVCICGKEGIADGRSIKSGETKSCGCLAIEKISKVNFKHGLSNKSPEYRAWKNLRMRCNNPNLPDYPDWGGRGIKVCSGWDSFITFLADVGKKPSPSHSINRINNDGMYSCGKCEECIKNNWPLNCRWDDPLAQARNRRKDTSAYSRAGKKRWAEAPEEKRKEWRRNMSIGISKSHLRNPQRNP